MINIISSKASAPNTLLQEVPRRDNEDNLRWLSRQPRCWRSSSVWQDTI
jgi:hypothetical protein